MRTGFLRLKCKTDGAVMKTKFLMITAQLLILLCAIGLAGCMLWGGIDDMREKARGKTKTEEIAGPTPGLAYTLINNDTAYSVSRGKATDADIVIPAMHEGLPVTAIAENGFRDHTQMISIIIPDTITDIGSSAFNNCQHLKSITIGCSITSIGNSSFSYCQSLENVTIGSNVTSIGDGAFSHCEALEYIVIPVSIKSIGPSVFDKCGKLKGIYYCGTDTDWSGIEIDPANNALNSIPPYFYSETDPETSDTHWHWVDGAPVLWGILHDGTPGLKFALNDEKNAYTVISSPVLREVDIIIPAEYNGLPVTAIAAYVFGDNSDVTSITIPASVTSINDNAFNDYYNLSSIIIDENNPRYASDGGLLYNKTKTELLLVPKNISGTVTLPDGITSIGENTFSNRSNLTGVIISDSVTSIGKDAFKNCISLKSVTIGSNVSIIESDAFHDCDKLTELIFGNSVTSIGEGAFQYCSSLINVTLPDSLRNIGSRAFGDCRGITKITIPGSVISMGDIVFENCTNLINVIIGDGMEFIADRAFQYCSNLTYVTIPDSITSIGAESFNNCNSLSAVFYGGANHSAWEQISIGENNGLLESVKRYYYSEIDYGVPYEYWHWVDGMPEVW